MKAPVTSGHSSWHSERNGARTTTLPRSEARETAWPSWLVKPHLLGRGSVEDQPLVGRGLGRRGRAAARGEQSGPEGEQGDEQARRAAWGGAHMHLNP